MKLTRSFTIPGTGTSSVSFFFIFSNSSIISLVGYLSFPCSSNISDFSERCLLTGCKFCTQRDFAVGVLLLYTDSLVLQDSEHFWKREKERK